MIGSVKLVFALAALLFGAAQFSSAGMLPEEFSFLGEARRQGVRFDSIAADLAEASLDKIEREVLYHSCSRELIVLRMRIAEMRWEAGQMAQAEASCRSAVEQCIECLPIQDSLRIKAQFALSVLLEAKGFYFTDDGEPYLRDALAGCDRSEWCKGKVRALLLRQVANAISFMGDLSSRDMYRESLHLLEEVDSSDSAEVATALWLLRKSLFEGLEWDESHQLLERLMQLHDVRPELQTPSRAAVLSAFGEDLHLEGKDVEALPYLREAIELSSTDASHNQCRLARTYGLVAECLNGLARFDEAVPFYEKSIATYENCGERNPPYFYVSATTKLGREFINHGDYERAERTLGHALAVAHDSLSLTQDAHIYLLLELARLYDLTDRPELAEDNYYRALTIAEMIHPFADPRVASFLEPYAEFCFEQGDYMRALPMQARAQKLWESKLGGNHPSVAVSTGRLSLMMRRSFHTDEWLGGVHVARLLQNHAWRARFDQYIEALNLLPEYQLIRLASLLQTEAGHMYTMWAEMPTENDSVGMIDMPTLKAPMWEVPYTRQRKQKSLTDPYDQALADTLSAIREKLAHLYVRSNVPELQEESKELFYQLGNAKRRITEELLARNPNFREGQELANCSARHISELLPDSSVLVDFVRYEHDITLRQKESRYLALVILPDSGMNVIPLGPATLIDSLALDYVREISGANELDAAEFRRVARNLYELIWEPIRLSIPNTKLIFVGPDAALNSVAFESLVDRNDTYLVESYRFHYVSSSRELYRTMRSSASSAEVGSGLLAMGDLNYDLSPDRSFIDVGLSDKDAPGFSTVTATDMALIRKRSGDMRESLQGVTWRSLPATLNEVESVTREWNAVCSEPAILLTEDMATEDSFKMNCRGKRVIYVATHGFTRAIPVYERSPEDDTEDNNVRVLTEQNPLLQSGIVFSGANQLVRAETELLGDDGIATGEEISCLDLEGVDLVVLSACHTGSGVVVNGEGVYSLRRAFELAGAKAVVSSLWAVDDRVTEELMTRTVRQVGATIGEALHGAMLDRIGELRAESLSDHPFYWAGFICSGDPRTRLFVESRGDSKEPSKRE